jgi:hypothetical protein
MGRVVLSAIALIITNLIVGSISLSLGLIVAVILIAMLLVALALFAALGLTTTMEKMGWLSPGWTDMKISAVKTWVKVKWHNLPSWYVKQKKRMIELLIETLHGKEESTETINIWKSAVIGLIILLAVVLVKQNLRLTVAWSMVVVAVGSVLVAIPAMYMAGRGKPAKRANLVGEPSAEQLLSPTEHEADPHELQEAFRTLIQLQRSGRLRLLLESPPAALHGWHKERSDAAPPAARSL